MGIADSKSITVGRRLGHAVARAHIKLSVAGWTDRESMPHRHILFRGHGYMVLHCRSADTENFLQNAV